MHVAATTVAAIGFVLIIAGASPSQRTVVPNQYATTEADSGTAFPFGRSVPMRVQCVYDKSTVAVPTMQVQALALRGDGGQSAAAKIGVDLEIAMSSAPLDPFSLVPTFAANRGQDWNIVWSRKLVDLPALTPGVLPAPFTINFPLDTPFVYSTSLGHLQVELIVHSQPAGNYLLDTSSDHFAIHTQVGSNCNGAQQSVLGGTANVPNAVLAWSLANGPPGGIALHLLGSQVLPVPLSLPGGCMIWQDFPVITPLTVSGSGAASLTALLIYNHVGAVVLSQFVCADPGINVISSSRSLQTVIGGFDRQGRVFSLGNTTDLTGTVQVGIANVTELTY